jgi:hypothetical protein
MILDYVTKYTCISNSKNMWCPGRCIILYTLIAY